jgi:hypothetical protein
MPKIVPEPSQDQLATLSEGTAAAKSHRKEPVLQPMRIVDTGDHSPAPTVAISAQGTVLPPKAKAPPVIEEVKSPRRFREEPKKTALVSNNIGLSAEPAPEGFNRNASVAAKHRNEPVFEYGDPVYPDHSKFSTPFNVEIAWLQTPVSVSGFVNSESTFWINKIRGLTMTWIPMQGLAYRIENQAGVYNGFIPEANVKNIKV